MAFHPSTNGSIASPASTNPSARDAGPGEAAGHLSCLPMTLPPPSTRKPGKPVLNKFVLYETKMRYFIVGTNAPSATRFRVLKIDRTTPPDELSITEDRTVYTKMEIDDLLATLRNGNKTSGGLKEVIKFYGIIGFVRFTEGYYISLVTKRSPVALIGGHYVFHIDSTALISIHPTTTPAAKLDKNSDEARYMQIFQMVDLSKNFYFSYSYDITRTLQWNMTRSRFEGRNQMFVWNQYLLENGFKDMKGIESQWALPIMYGFVDQSKISILGRNVFVTLIARRSRHFAGARFLKRGVNDQGYVANDVETEQIVSEMSTTSFYGSGSYAVNPNHTSFVQHRGSIPLYWTQDGTNMTPKPPIALSVVDPYFSAAALHFDDMFKRYGTPCIALNLIKTKEKTPRESLLLAEFSECIEYLNHFLPEEKKIQHIKWDMSRASKSHNENVIAVLEIIAEKTFGQTGFFHSGYNQQQHHHWIHKQHHHSIPRSLGEPNGAQGDSSGANDLESIPMELRLKYQNTRINMVQRRRDDRNIIYGTGLQNGVVRTNCIDCLDRTNAAQFVIAKHALGYQLYSLGLISEPFVPFDCDVVNMLTEMYHDHGDTIALQYGGSHLVNTMETYRKINQWTSHSRDMIESIRRFYSNSFVDTEKQFAMNLFLGNFVVRKGRPAIWELPSDYHLHNQWPVRTSDLMPDTNGDIPSYVPPAQKPRRTYTKWWTPDALLPQDELIKKLTTERRQRQLEAYQLQVQEMQQQKFQEQQQKVFEDHKIYRREKLQYEQGEPEQGVDEEQEFMLHDDGYDERAAEHLQNQRATSTSSPDHATLSREGTFSEEGSNVTPEATQNAGTNRGLVLTASTGDDRQKSIAECKLSSFASLKSVSDILEGRQQRLPLTTRPGSSQSLPPLTSEHSHFSTATVATTATTSTQAGQKEDNVDHTLADNLAPPMNGLNISSSVSDGALSTLSNAHYADILGAHSISLQPVPSSSSSSISSFQLGGGFLHGSKSKSSIGSNSVRAYGVHATKGEELVYRGMDACRDSDEEDEEDEESESEDTASLSDSSTSLGNGSSVHGAKKLSASEFARLELELALESGREVRLDVLGSKKRMGKTVKSALKKEWDEYWDEYYRPKVQTSFQRLFAFNMNSTSRYIPPNIKDASEQSPFEVRLYHHNIPQQAEHKSKTSNSETMSIGSWLGLGRSKDSAKRGDNSSSTSSSSSSSSSAVTSTKNAIGANTNVPVSGAAHNSKSLPWVSGSRLVGGNSGGGSHPNQNRGHGYGSGDSIHRRSMTSFVASQTGSSATARYSADMSNMSSASSISSGSTLVQAPAVSGGAGGKKSSKHGSGPSRILGDPSFVVVRGGSRIVKGNKVKLVWTRPRTKYEEWELTKNVQTNIPRFAIHDAEYKEDGSTGDGREDSILDASRLEAAAGTAIGSREETDDAAGDHVVPPGLVAGGSSSSLLSDGGGVNGTGRSKGSGEGKSGSSRPTGIEQMVKRSFRPEVPAQEMKEYKRYTHQFRNIHFSSVPALKVAGLNAPMPGSAGGGKGADEETSSHWTNQPRRSSLVGPSLTAILASTWAAVAESAATAAKEANDQKAAEAVPSIKDKFGAPASRRSPMTRQSSSSGAVASPSPASRSNRPIQQRKLSAKGLQNLQNKTSEALKAGRASDSETDLYPSAGYLSSSPSGSSRRSSYIQHAKGQMQRMNSYGSTLSQELTEDEEFTGASSMGSQTQRRRRAQRNSGPYPSRHGSTELPEYVEELNEDESQTGPASFPRLGDVSEEPSVSENAKEEQEVGDLADDEAFHVATEAPRSLRKKGVPGARAPLSSFSGAAKPPVHKQQQQKSQRSSPKIAAVASGHQTARATTRLEQQQQQQQQQHHHQRHPSWFVQPSEQLPEAPILLPPLPISLRAPAPYDLMLYEAHVDLPKRTLFTAGQISLNPYWGATPGTRARYDAYQGWIQKGRYGHPTHAASHAAGAGGVAAAAAASGGGGQGARHSWHAPPHPPAKDRSGHEIINSRGHHGVESLGTANGGTGGHSHQDRQSHRPQHGHGHGHHVGPDRGHGPVGLGLGIA